MLSGVVLWAAFAAGCSYELRTPAGGGWVAVSVGSWTACAAHADGQTECFGLDRRDAVTVATRGWVDLAHEEAVCGIDGAGHATCHDPKSSRHPRPMGADVVQVVTYGYGGFACALGAGGDVACSGADLDVDTTELSGSTSLALSDTDLCGLADGQATCLSLEGSQEPTEGREQFLVGPWVEFGVGESLLCGVTPASEVRCDADLALPGRLHGLSVNPSQFGVACALDDDDRPVCTGGQENEEVPDVALRTLSVGAYHACGITQGDGSLVCWNWAVPPYR